MDMVSERFILEYESSDGSVQRRGNRVQAADSHERVRDADGEVQFQNDLQTTVSDIKALVTSLDDSQKDHILTELLCMGRGSLDFAKNLLSTAGNPPSPPGNAVPQWCKCLSLSPDGD
ncbi:hypothetical protein ABFA07_016500 [Porites harrisoni]